MATYEQIFRKNHYDLRTVMTKSRTWFDQQARLLATKQIVPQRLIRTNTERNVIKIIPGELYLFNYDAKHKDTLPFWDTFPLVFPFRKMPDGFIGLNMHYLPYPLRIRLLDRLMSYKSNTAMDETTRLKMSWGTLSSLSTQFHVEPCVHRYLIGHIKSPLKRIDSNDWATAMMLPVERFQGSTKQKVWQESLR